MSVLSPSPLLVYGLGITNRAAARQLVRRGYDVILADDGDPAVGDAFGSQLGLSCLHPLPAELGSVMAGIGSMLPTPGLKESHPAMIEAERRGIAVFSEFDLAGEWDDRPIVAITGTNGKTTVVTMVRDMLVASGIRAVDAGNTETPLVEAIEDPSVQVFVVEASSFRLGHSQRFTPSVATWLNFAPDHLDIHRDLERYELAKARIFEHQDAGGRAVANLDDPVVMRHAVGPAPVVTFGSTPDADYHEHDSMLVRPDGSTVVAVGDLPRSLPHDRTNALAAAASAELAGATHAGVADTLVNFSGLRHRVELVGSRHDISWFDDSKATAPHATTAAVRGFTSVVLIAGGRNKGLDLSVLADLDNVVAFVAIGEAAEEIQALTGRRPVVVASSMAEAVAAARQLAKPGDVVLLSPACASFDWYANYGERGDDFVTEVRSQILTGVAS